MERVNVLFPLEVINRDLDYRLFLAVKAANERNRVFVGQHDAIYRLSRSMRGGIYLGQYVFRSLFPQETGARYRDVKSRGFAVIHLHEEGAIYYGGPKDWGPALRQRIDPTAMDGEDHVLTWGETQRQALLEMKPRCAANIRTTGHPRFDLLTRDYRAYYEEDVAALPKPPSRFVLINTNLVLANSCMGLSDTFSAVRNYDPASAQSRLDHFAKWGHNNRILVGFVEMINRVSLELPSVHFVVRPHPAENHDYYKEIFRGIGNVSVVHHGSVMPWVLASELLLHNGCTTGIEARLAGKPVINYFSMPEGKYDCYLPNVFGQRCTTPDEVIDTIGAILAGEGDRATLEHVPNQARSLMANFEQESFPRVLEVLAEVEQTAARREQRWSRRQHRAGEAIHAAGAAAKGVARRFAPARRARFQAFSQIFYGFQEAVVRTKLDRIQRMLGKRVTFELHSPELLSIEHA